VKRYDENTLSVAQIEDCMKIKYYLGELSEMLTTIKAHLDDYRLTKWEELRV
jgi:hypothetical protein